MYRFVQILLVLLAAPATLSCAYLLLLTLLSSRLAPPPRAPRALRFDCIVPAHDEEAGIRATVDSLLRCDWPRDRFRVLVVADNCSDRTALVAREAGAVVLERRDDHLRGKGYALACAFAVSLEEAWADVAVVVDADAQVSANLLEAFAARIACGHGAVQAHYGVLNAWASWRTQLMTIAKGAFHIVRSRARERLGLSCGLRGNGWCVTHAWLREVPYRAYSLTEDLEYGIELGLAGRRVAYADEAHANADMVSSGVVATAQRRRWEQGRFALVRECTATLLGAALRQRSVVCLDLAIDLMVLPLSYVVMNVAAVAALAGVARLSMPVSNAWFSWCAACVAALVAYVLRGWWLSGIGLRGLWALAHVPGFLAWKLVVLLGRRTTQWIRTGRER